MPSKANVKLKRLLSSAAVDVLSERMDEYKAYCQQYDTRVYPRVRPLTADQLEVINHVLKEAGGIGTVRRDVMCLDGEPLAGLVALASSAREHLSDLNLGIPPDECPTIPYYRVRWLFDFLRNAK